MRRIRYKPITIKKFIADKINFLSYKNISKAKYLIRLDDSCSTQHKKNWDKLEKIFDKLNINPIVAVIPFNKDKNLFINNEDKFFWAKVKSWQSKGWEIAVHGHSHLYHKVKKNNLIFPFYDRSEFGGLDLDEQSRLIKESYEHFLKNEIKPTIWIAPSHTFDKNTIIALKNNTKICFISDGISLEPFKLMEIIFLPQQLWIPRKKLYGIWTICLHPNSMNDESIDKFQKIISEPFYKDKFINTNKAKSYIKNFSIISYLYSNNFWLIRSFKINIKKLLNL